MSTLYVYVQFNALEESLTEGERQFECWGKGL